MIGVDQDSIGGHLDFMAFRTEHFEEGQVVRIGQEIVDGRLHPLLPQKAQGPLDGAGLAEDFFEEDMVPRPIFHGTGRGIDDYQTLIVDPGGDAAAFPGGDSKKRRTGARDFSDQHLFFLLGQVPGFPQKHASSLHRGADGPIEGTGKASSNAQEKTEERQQDRDRNNPLSGHFTQWLQFDSPEFGFRPCI